MSALEVAGLTKHYSVRREDRPGREQFVALDGVSYGVEAGKSLAILGESGSGKSTSARIIVGLERADAGEVTVEGVPWNPTRPVPTRQRRARGGLVQMVFQDPYQSLDRRQRVREALDEALRLHTDLSAPARRERVLELLAQVRLDPALADAYPRRLSGGQRQRVAIARALAAEPRVIVLDEAVSALDVTVQAQILDLLDSIRLSTNVAYLFITHDLPVARRLCQTVVVMQAGRIVESGDIEAVLSNPQADYTSRLIQSVPREGWKPQRRLDRAVSSKENP